MRLLSMGFYCNPALKIRCRRERQPKGRKIICPKHLQQIHLENSKYFLHLLSGKEQQHLWEKLANAKLILASPIVSEYNPQASRHQQKRVDEKHFYG